MTTFFTWISLAGGRISHNYSFLIIWIKLPNIILLVTQHVVFTSSSLMFIGRWNFFPFHLKDDLIFFSLTRASQTLLFVSFILGKQWTAPLTHICAVEKHSHEHVSFVIHQHSLFKNQGKWDCYYEQYLNQQSTYSYNSFL